MGVDELTTRLAKWEGEISTSQQSQGDQIVTLPEITSMPPPGTQTMIQVAPEPETGERPAESAQDLLRYALIGLAFDTGERLEAGIHTFDRLTRLVGDLSEPLFSPIYKSRMLSPFRRNFESLVQRGQDEVDRWIVIGRTEESNSRLLAQTAIIESVDEGVEYFAANPEVQNLVQTQSISLAGELITEVRERSVSADTFLEGLVRMMFRKSPRSELPPPPPQIQAEAITFIEMRNKKTADR
jgi:hypothetical protein